MAPRTHSVRVRIREVAYSSVVENALGQPYLAQRAGYGPGRPEIRPEVRGDDVSETDKQDDFRLGEKIELIDEEYLRLKGAGAVEDADVVEEEEEEADDVEELDVATASVDDLARWIVQEKPNANETVAASDGQPELAQKLLEAEAKAAQETNGEPRKTVVDGLSAVISRG